MLDTQYNAIKNCSKLMYRNFWYCIPDDYVIVILFVELDWKDLAQDRGQVTYCYEQDRGQVTYCYEQDRGQVTYCYEQDRGQVTYSYEQDRGQVTYCYEEDRGQVTIFMKRTRDK
jgi:hypothetical protein